MGKQTAHCKVGKQTEHTDFWKHRKKIKKVESFEKKVNFLKFQTIITEHKHKHKQKWMCWGLVKSRR